MVRYMLFVASIGVSLGLHAAESPVSDDVQSYSTASGVAGEPVTTGLAEQLEQGKCLLRARSACRKSLKNDPEGPLPSSEHEVLSNHFLHIAKEAERLSKAHNQGLADYLGISVEIVNGLTCENFLEIMHQQYINRRI